MSEEEEEEESYQFKRPLHILRGEVAPLAIDVEEAILDGSVEHGFAHDRVVRIRNVDDGELDRSGGSTVACHRCGGRDFCD